MEGLLKTFNLIPLDALMIVAWAIIFVVFWQLLAKFFFLPYLALIEHRESATTGARSKIAGVLKSAEESEKEYERQILSHRIKLMQKRGETLNKAKSTAAREMEEAELAAQRYLDEQRKRNARMMEDLSRNLDGEAQSLADLMISRLEEQGSSTQKGSL